MWKPVARIPSILRRLTGLLVFIPDYLITRYFYDNPRQFSPAMLTDLRSATVSNDTFVVLAVRNRFYLHLARLSLPLDAMIDSFVKSQEENGHLLLHDVSFHFNFFTNRFKLFINFD